MLPSWQRQWRRILLPLIPFLSILLSWTPCAIAQDSEVPTTAPTATTTNSTTGLNIDYELESILALRWKLLKPRIAYDGLRFDLVFTTSDYVQEEMIIYTLYDSHECSSGGTVINDARYFDTLLQGDGTPAGGGLLTRQMTLSTTIVPQNIANSASYEEFGDVATIRFCVRFGLHNDDTTVNPGAKEINYLETTITLIVDLKDDFKIQDPIVEARDAAQKTSDDAFFVEGFICTEDGVRPQDVLPLFQGQTVRVCVQPTRQALDVGFRIRWIDSFVFTQETVTQEAVVERRAAPNALTELYCEGGSEQCSFETLLMAAFFRGPSLVSGKGVATLQFGSESNRRLRSLGVVPQGLPKSFDLDFFGVKYTRNKFADHSSTTSNSSVLFALFNMVAVMLVVGRIT